MKKIWIIHNSMYGNSERISNQLAEGLKDSYDVSVDSIKNLSPEKIAKDEPYGLIFAARILAFRVDRKIRKFLSELNNAIIKPIAKISYFSTHAMNWREGFIKGLKKLLEHFGCVEEVCPEYLEIKLKGNKGPGIEGTEEKITEYISTLKEFMK